MRLLLTCEHAGARVPAPWRELFEGGHDLLASHRGHDIGAWALARHLARTLDAPLLGHHVTRLLVDANRSPGHPRFFSEITRGLPPAERARLVREHWEPHRRRVREAIDGLLARGGPVVHVGVHTFTPVLRGVARTMDVGLLYDPSRRREASLCASWKEALVRRDPTLRVRRNRPYLGISDGLVTALRRERPERSYAGVELEVSQGALSDPSLRRRLYGALAETLAEALSAPPSRPSPPRPPGAA
ncbi:MAG: N-formylglutamate amidohydrolase [Gemmatimonadetes bacterium]|nr:N-formylglutamate amidohydrolase [Gemmatimonadota bacterium]